MAYELCPISIAPPELIAISPSLTYKMLNSLIDQAAASFTSLGCRRGDRIAIPLDLQEKTIALMFATWRIGCIAVLVSPKLPLKTKSSYLSSLSIQKLPEHLFSNSKTGGNNILDLDSPALMLLTSGSSGSPKWASFSLSQLFESARTVGRALEVKPKERWLLSIPLYHVGGLSLALRALLSRGTLCFEDKSLPFQERILQASPHFASLVPTQLYRLLKQAPLTPKTHFLIGGAPLAQSLYTQAHSLGYRLSLAYGLTEMSSTVLLTETPTWQGHLAYSGKPLPNRHLTLNPSGELHVAGNSLFSGYGFPPMRPPSPFPTGDLAIHHPTLGWAIQGRKDFQFFSGGENIQPEEIEAALLSHPDVEEAVVVAKPDEEFGARPVAFIRTSLSQQTLIAYLSDRIEKYKIPLFFYPLKETTQFKPSRKELARSLANL